MNLSEMLPTLQALPRPEKWQLIQFLVADLAREEEQSPIEAGRPYPIWSPHHAFDAAAALLKALDEEAGECGETVVAAARLSNSAGTTL